MKILLLGTFILFCLLGLSIGIILIISPGFAIEIQRKFYEKINWRITPISMEKELANTRIMGYFLLLLFALTAALILTNKITFPSFRY